MNLFTKTVLKSLSIVSIIAQVLFAFAGLMLLFASGALLFVSKGLKTQLLQYTDLYSNTNLSVWFLVLSCLVALAIIACLFIIMYALNKMIGNIYEQHYFVSQNLKYLKLILISISSFTVLQFISQLFFAQAHAYNVSHIFSESWPSLLGCILLLAIVYTIYVVFKYGISLQDDSNNVI
ncbi:DUF2975 domain-containing protein [Lederbergia galactosidilytica]|uniref:DUF2975 domain-containing protein n=1 Tax=Lederbergia galactosidilytica TaxID=217031 RepID=A0A0Q9YAX5_9BACI|nr:DUF2975 domain-containing protein [Lederbergia galactosidilytica]KRG12257.1 hypothetical protein ACA30_19420 [Virgibacillus soli]KRG13064.1 hypothetical protein ACA29_09490 [Lederbergia galactosidilytica]OAK73979.1 hypothetical protein ABB05_06040 [Lederbergia galactosidilytica]